MKLAKVGLVAVATVGACVLIGCEEKKATPPTPAPAPAPAPAPSDTTPPAGGTSTTPAPAGAH